MNNGLQLGFNILSIVTREGRITLCLYHRNN